MFHSWERKKLRVIFKIKEICKGSCRAVITLALLSFSTFSWLFASHFSIYFRVHKMLSLFNSLVMQIPQFSDNFRVFHQIQLSIFISVFQITQSEIVETFFPIRLVISQTTPFLWQQSWILMNVVDLITPYRCY